MYICVCVCICINEFFHNIACVYIYTHIYAYIHTSIHTHTHTHTHTSYHACICLHMCKEISNARVRFVCQYMRQKTQTHIHTARPDACVYTYVNHIHTRIDTHMYIYTHTYTHIDTQIHTEARSNIQHTHTHTHKHTHIHTHIQGLVRTFLGGQKAANLLLILSMRLVVWFGEAGLYYAMP